MTRPVVCLFILAIATLACRFNFDAPISAAKAEGLSPVVNATPVPMREMIVCGAGELPVGGLRVRESAGTDNRLHPVLDYLSDGTPVTIIEKTTDGLNYEWDKITYQGGAGFVRARYLCSIP